MNRRVYWAQDPMNFGTVLEEDGREARVRWDEDGPKSRGSWYKAHELKDAQGPRQDNLPTIFAPEIQDLEFMIRLHPVTHTLVMERDENYRGGPGPVIVEPEDVWELFSHMAELDTEHIVVILLDVRHNLIGWTAPHHGQLAGVEASVRDMLKAAILSNAAKVIVLHNHPSGDPSPSEADKDLTAALEVLGSEFGVELYDHVIVGRPRPDDEGFAPYYSFREDGQIEEVEDDGT